MMAEFINTEGFINPTSPDISKHQTHEIVGYNKEEPKNWWKFRIKCTSETDKGKIEIFWTRYLVSADDMEKALKLVVAKEKLAAMPGEIEAAAIAKIDFLLIPFEVK